MTQKLEQLFISKNKIMEKTINKKLLYKNRLKIKVKSLSKTTIITIVAMLGAVIFSFSLANLVVN